MSNNVILEAKPIGKIKGRFFIPTYQRGYRWTKSQVSTLLNDLWNNCKPEVDIQREYCLQPVVVRKRNEDDYELIDGQQRFTTILILLNYIKREWKPRTNIMFQLDYETRKHPPIGCKYTKYNLVPHFIGDFFVSLYCPL